RTRRAGFERWDPATGAVETLAGAHTVTLTLQPYQATVVVATDRPDAPDCPIVPDREQVLELTGPWRFGYADADPAAGSTREVALPHRWEDDRPGWSGAATYRLELTADPAWLAPDARVTLDFGPCQPTADADQEAVARGNSYRVAVAPPVREVAVVAVNGEPCGVVWDAPYRIDLTGRFRAGGNTLSITVHNTGAAAVATDPDAAGVVAESRRL